MSELNRAAGRICEVTSGAGGSAVAMRAKQLYMRAIEGIECYLGPQVWAVLDFEIEAKNFNAYLELKEFLVEKGFVTADELP